MEKITATQTLQDMYLPDRRRQRVDALVHATMNALDKFIADDDRKAAYYALVDLFTSKGIDILTAEDRERIGLPPHNEKGWTDQEVRVLELKRMEALLRPMPMMFVKPREEGNTDG